MNLRHAAALALVGWYLMLPPMQGETPNSDAPLSQWTLTDSFDSAQQCSKGKSAYWKTLMKISPRLPKTESIIVNRQASAAMCIATDDPRLMGTDFKTGQGRPN